ncbi:Cysteine--tRNA ligase [Galdieria sulphuraria]|uniref:cysteine--tRNA ligase n=1 Tax=Galdieria sulphuraria TaxID=130081 RepID=M2Y8X9_GALSU|nr:cysteinyl-tRNA synthetase [Galdieria sulphuraria]EME32533.1 cysteinyl-tRNA synthetase [Galdieria sulphuraria]GJD08069.1 Cysteine--tRNA ligase [Galdieria sulphuraria]|eukprot:XP_005709053.1 cysteinyl-tRNA synthetase [Galdieria sulphuraria]
MLLGKTSGRLWCYLPKSILFRRTISAQFRNKHNASDSPSPTSFHWQPFVRSSLVESGKDDLRPICYASDTPSSYLSWYICGPTVYDEAHIGHARTYVTFDIIRRILEDYFHFRVFLALGITDIDDKIIHKARENQTTVLDITSKYTKQFFRDMKALGVRSPDAILAVSQHIPSIIQFIQKLIDNEMAYVTSSGVYFAVDRLTYRYGRFRCVHSPLTSWDQESDYLLHKRDVRDFVLWKRSNDDEPGWPSPWMICKGRPGWHVECSAMINALFGSELDIHGGGIDLIFPHHENELAQCCAYFERENWCRYWLHIGHLSIAGRKMSKSLKNFITIQEMLCNMSAAEFRMFCLLHHYQSPVEYGKEQIEEAKQTWKRLLEWDQRCRSFLHQHEPLDDYPISLSPTMIAIEMSYKQQVVEWKTQIAYNLAMNLNTPLVIQIILVQCRNMHRWMDEWEKDTNHSIKTITRLGILRDAYQYIHQLFHIFGLEMPSHSNKDNSFHSPRDSEWIEIIAKFRQQLRMLLKDKTIDDKQLRKQIFDICDMIRDVELKKINIELKDNKDGSYQWQYLIDHEDSSRTS